MSDTPPRAPSPSPLELAARAFAAAAHAAIGQTRTGGAPYIVHPDRVAARLAELGFRPEVVAAGYLHDTVEDTATTLADIEAAFGSDVARLVAGVTSPSRREDGNRATRKAIDRAFLASGDWEIQSIKIADLDDNCEDMVVSDPSFAAVYLPEKAELLDVLVKGHPALRERAKATIERGLRQLALAPPAGRRSKP